MAAVFTCVVSLSRRLALACCVLVALYLASVVVCLMNVARCVAFLVVAVVLTHSRLCLFGVRVFVRAPLRAHACEATQTALTLQAAVV